MEKKAEARLRGFALVTLGQLVSMIGTRALAFGLGVWVYLATGSATQFSVILVFGLLPALLVLPFAGAAADRWNRRLVMIIGDLVALAGSGLCLALFATGSLHVWHLYIAARPERDRGGVPATRLPGRHDPARAQAVSGPDQRHHPGTGRGEPGDRAAAGRGADRRRRAARSADRRSRDRGRLARHAGRGALPRPAVPAA
nr:hypothetical protein GCM10020092_077240 [Actinoplanes digitatis]